MRNHIPALMKPVTRHAHEVWLVHLENIADSRHIMVCPSYESACREFERRGSWMQLTLIHNRGTVDVTDFLQLASRRP
jgi:hypothetical protein